MKPKDKHPNHNPGKKKPSESKPLHPKTDPALQAKTPQSKSDQPSPAEKPAQSKPLEPSPPEKPAAEEDNKKTFKIAAKTVFVIAMILLLIRGCVGKGCNKSNTLPSESPKSADVQGITLVTNSYKREVQVGQKMEANVSWNNVDPAQYLLVMSLKDRYKGTGKDGRISLEKTFDLPSSSGTKDLDMFVPENTPGGTARLEIYLENKDSKDRVRGLDEDVMINVLSNVLINSHPAVVRAGAVAKINVSWKNIKEKTRYLGLKISNFSDKPGFMPTYVERFFDLPSEKGTRDFNVDVPLDTPEGLCYVYAFVTSKSLGWRGRATEMRTPDDVLNIKSGVTIRTFPTKVLVEESAEIGVAWNEVEFDKYNLGIKISNYIHEPGDTNKGEDPIYIEQKYELTSKEGKSTFKLSIPRSSHEGKGYVYAYLNSKKEGWKGRIAESKTSDNIVTVIPRIIIRSYPKEVHGGETLPIKVSWNEVDLAKFKLSKKKMEILSRKSIKAF